MRTQLLHFLLLFVIVLPLSAQDQEADLGKGFSIAVEKAFRAATGQELSDLQPGVRARILAYYFSMQGRYASLDESKAELYQKIRAEVSAELARELEAERRREQAGEELDMGTPVEAEIEALLAGEYDDEIRPYFGGTLPSVPDLLKAETEKERKSAWWDADKIIDNPADALATLKAFLSGMEEGTYQTAAEYTAGEVRESLLGEIERAEAEDDYSQLIVTDWEILETIGPRLTGGAYKALVKATFGENTFTSEFTLEQLEADWRIVDIGSASEGEVEEFARRKQFLNREEVQAAAMVLEELLQKMIAADFEAVLPLTTGTAREQLKSLLQDPEGRKEVAGEVKELADWQLVGGEFIDEQTLVLEFVFITVDGDRQDAEAVMNYVDGAWKMLDSR